MMRTRSYPPYRSLICGLAAMALVAGGCGRPDELRAPAIGAPAPDYAAITPDGQSVTLASLKGQVVVLNIWATWCRPCLEEIPQLTALHAQHVAQGVKVIGVSIDAAGMGADVTDFAREHRLSYDVWLDPDRNVSVKFLTVGAPETFVIDRAGVIRARVIGAIRAGDTTLTAAVQRALQDPA
jgi:cytochrome c biogenesis protein CcmG/thiol:disulfide interchange protein DsbE